MLLICVATASQADRVWSDTPIPRDHRVLCSLLTIMPVMMLSAALTAFFIRIWEQIAVKRVLVLCGAIAALLAWGAGVASRDEINDEHWSPCMEGMYFTALVPGLTLIILDRRMQLALRILVAILIIGVSFFPLGLLLESWQKWGHRVGLPTTW